MSQTFQSFSNEFFRTLDRKLEPPVKNHLKQVYSTLALATFAAGVGSYVHLFSGFLRGGFLTALGAMAFGLMVSVTHDDGKNYNKRLSYLAGFAACTGLSLGPLIEMALYLDPNIVPLSLMATCLVFASFSLSSIFSNHGKWLYMGAGLMSIMSTMLLMSIVNIFIGSYYLFQAQLYLGLIVFCLFVMYDTAVIIEKRRMGETDSIKHAMLLFMDLADLFRTFLVILMQKRNDQRSNRNRR